MITPPFHSRLGQLEVYPTAESAISVANSAIALLNTARSGEPAVAELPNSHGFIAQVQVSQSLSASQSRVIPGAVVVDADGTPVGLAFEAYTDSCDSGHLERWVEYFDGSSTPDDHELVPT